MKLALLISYIRTSLSSFNFAHSLCNSRGVILRLIDKSSSLILRNQIRSLILPSLNTTIRTALLSCLTHQAQQCTLGHKTLGQPVLPLSLKHRIATCLRAIVERSLSNTAVTASKSTQLLNQSHTHYQNLAICITRKPHTVHYLNMKLQTVHQVW